MMVAHNKLAERSEAVMAILREMVAAEGSGMCPPQGLLKASKRLLKGLRKAWRCPLLPFS